MKIKHANTACKYFAQLLNEIVGNGLLLSLLLFNVDSARLGESESVQRPYQSKNPSPTIPTYRKKEVKVITAEDKKRAISYGQ